MVEHRNLFITFSLFMHHVKLKTKFTIHLKNGLSRHHALHHFHAIKQIILDAISIGKQINNNVRITKC